MTRQFTRTDLIKITVKVINDVMDANQREKGDTWTKKSAEEHLRHAFVHVDGILENEIATAIGEYNANCSPMRKSHLAHALTRLAMAFCVRFGTEYMETLIGGNTPYMVEKP